MAVQLEEVNSVIVSNKCLLSFSEHLVQTHLFPIVSQPGAPVLPAPGIVPTFPSRFGHPSISTHPPMNPPSSKYIYYCFLLSGLLVHVHPKLTSMSPPRVRILTRFGLHSCNSWGYCKNTMYAFNKSPVNTD